MADQPDPITELLDTPAPAAEPPGQRMHNQPAGDWAPRPEHLPPPATEAGKAVGGASRFPKVAGCCPMGCGSTLFLADGGHITCSLIGCPDPTKADDLLHDRETEHIVLIGAGSFNLQHPLRERGEDLFNCTMHQRLSELAGPPVKRGRYRVTDDGAGAWRWTEVPDA